MVNSPAIVLRFLRCASWLLLLLAAVLDAKADIPVPRPSGVPTRSRSGQFLVLGELGPLESDGSSSIRIPGAQSQRTVTLNPLRPMDQQGLAALNPPVVSVACERVKAGVLRILRLEDRYRGSIVVRILKADVRKPPAGIIATQYAEGWNYAVEFQERIHWTLLVRTLVEVTLLEVANRSNPGPLSPIPLWLSEGTSTLLIGEGGRELVPQLNRDFKDPARSLDPLAVVAAKMAGRPPLGFEVLAQPPETLVGDTNRFLTFQGSSALLVHQLRSLGADSGSLGRLVGSFNQVLNWQTGFLRTYSTQFASFLDVEKWWGVVSMAFHVQDANQRMTPETWTVQMRTVLTELVEISLTTNGLPQRRTLKVSEIMEQWPYPAQEPVLNRKLAQLRMLSRLGDALARREAEDAPLNLHLRQLDRYLGILAQYREARSGGTSGANRGEPDRRVRLLVSSSARRLRALEEDLLGGSSGDASAMASPGR